MANKHQKKFFIRSFSLRRLFGVHSAAAAHAPMASAHRRIGIGRQYQSKPKNRFAFSELIHEHFYDFDFYEYCNRPTMVCCSGGRRVGGFWSF